MCSLETVKSLVLLPQLVWSRAKASGGIRRMQVTIMGFSYSSWPQNRAQQTRNLLVDKKERSCTLIDISIRCKFFFHLIGREPTTWPANNYLQIKVCSSAMSSNFVPLQIIFCSCVNETTLFSFLRSLLCENGRSLRFRKTLIYIFLEKPNSMIECKTIIELSCRKISCVICQSLAGSGVW